MGRLASAVGIWELELGEVVFELKPTIKHVRTYRTMLLKNSKDQNAMFDAFETFLYDLIAQQYPDEVSTDEDKETLQSHIALNIMHLFEESQVTFKFTTREQLEKSKKDALAEVKKVIGGE
jgi:hypothetical protein|tara:strand:+ start:18065 stop:18427 length:363 start_codon:yes stop_codon:yes gene_type:complete